MNDNFDQINAELNLKETRITPLENGISPSKIAQGSAVGPLLMWNGTNYVPYQRSRVVAGGAASFTKFCVTANPNDVFYVTIRQWKNASTSYPLTYFEMSAEEVIPGE